MKISNFALNRKGFTLVEFLITLSILAVLTTIIFIPMSALRNSKALQITAEDILSLLNEARDNTLSAKDSYAYGTRFESSRAVLFRGTSYSSSDPSNKTADIDGAVEISNISLAGGGQEVLFQRLTGKTSQSGTITIRLKSNVSKTKTILIEASGVASSN